MTFDSRTEANIATLTPKTQALARAFMTLATGAESPLPAGWTVKIIQGRRTYDEQDADYAQGRSEPGKIITDAPAGFSNHNFGLAFDVGIFDQHGDYIDDDYAQERVDQAYKDLAPLGKSVGLTWGGDFTTIQDFPHYERQLDPTKSENENLAMCRRMTANGETIA